MTAWNSISQMLEVLAGSIYLNFAVMSILEIVSVGVYSITAKRLTILSILYERMDEVETEKSN